MRKFSEISSNCRAMARSQRGWGDKVHADVLGGGGNQMVPSALAVLAANEAVLMFWLVKLSNADPTTEEPFHDEPVNQAGSAD